MAQRFGGKYSPGAATGTTTADPRVEDRMVKFAGRRARFLYLPAVLLVVTSLNDGPVALVTALIGGGILALAAFLLQQGLEAEAAFNARKVARRPAIPRKMFASVLTGVGAAIAAYSGDNGMIGSALYGLAAVGLHVAAFGIDPLSDKRMEGVDTFQQDRVARVVDEAEAHLETSLRHRLKARPT